jgi:hypothetical protein
LATVWVAGDMLTVVPAATAAFVVLTGTTTMLARIKSINPKERIVFTRVAHIKFFTASSSSLPALLALP